MIRQFLLACAIGGVPALCLLLMGLSGAAGWTPVTWSLLLTAGASAILAGAALWMLDRLAEALRAAEAGGLPRFTAMQPELNLLDRDQYEGALQQLCIAEGLGVVTYFSLASGYLSGKYRSADDLGKSPRGARATASLDGKGPAMLAVMDRIAGETGATLSQIALAWVAAQPGVTAPIASATSAAQVEELAVAVKLRLDADDIARLDAVSA